MGELANQAEERPAAGEASELSLADKLESKGSGIEILVAMAEAGDIDPKNIDIIDVTDRFLKAIAAAPKENLRQSGKTLFFASVLLRMKAEALLDSGTLDVIAGDDYIDFDDSGSPIIYDSRFQAVGRQITLKDLERALIRRLATRQIRQRKVTLEQLIEALREAERIEISRGKRQPRAVIDLEGQHDITDVGDILDLAHDEDIETVIQRVEAIIGQWVKSKELLPLAFITERLSGGGDWVDAFLAALFLSNAGKIVLEQEEFYGPLFFALSDGWLASEELSA